MKIKDFVLPRENMSRFSHMQGERGSLESALYYTAVHTPTGKTYQFPIPVSDLAGSVTLSREEKAMTLMRYIRKALGYQYEGEGEDPHPERGLLETTPDDSPDFDDESACTFDYYRARLLYYRTPEGDIFPVPEESGKSFSLYERESFLFPYMEKAREEGTYVQAR